MSFLGAALTGIFRTLGSPLLLIGLWAVNLLVALPAAIALSGSIESSVGGSLVHENLRSGFDMNWFGEYAAQARGIETTFTPAVVGVAPFIANLERWMTGELFTEVAAIVALGLLYALLWSFFLGGVIERYVHPGGDNRGARFFLHSGRYFFRFLRLALIAALLYAAVYKLYRWLMSWLEQFTRDITSEGTVLLYTLIGSALVVVLLLLIHISFGYAKIVTVADDRRSMLLAALGGLAFVATHPVQTLGLYATLGLVSVGTLALYGWLAPGAGQSSMLGVLFAFGLGQLVLMSRLFMRLSLLGGQAALYQDLSRR